VIAPDSRAAPQVSAFPAQARATRALRQVRRAAEDMGTRHTVETEETPVGGPLGLHLSNESAYAEAPTLP
jgi:hypothetical protein